MGIGKREWARLDREQVQGTENSDLIRSPARPCSVIDLTLYLFNANSKSCDESANSDVYLYTGTKIIGQIKIFRQISMSKIPAVGVQDTMGVEEGPPLIDDDDVDDEGDNWLVTLVALLVIVVVVEPSFLFVRSYGVISV